MEKEKLLILVIDPSRSDRRVIRESLHRSRVPARLHFVPSTEKGLRQIQKKKFDLILTDHCLPEANAFHLLFELRKRGSGIPVIVVTHEGEARLAREAFRRGADDYILKEELGTISLFDVVGNIIERRHEREEREERENILREQAERDGLTGLYNHRFFVDALEREFARARRYHRQFSLLMLDLDGFKSINDTCGHLPGDQVLRQTAHLLLQTVRFVDVVARYGGDEFVILLPETDLRTSSKLAQRIVDEIRKNPFLYEDKVYSISASLGVACYRPDQASPGVLLRETDRALYEAKRKGRDRVATATQPHHQPTIPSHEGLRQGISPPDILH